MSDNIFVEQRFGVEYNEHNDPLYYTETLQNLNYVKPVVFMTKEKNRNNDNGALIIPILPKFNNNLKIKKIKKLRIDLPLTDENDRANFMAPDLEE